MEAAIKLEQPDLVLHLGDYVTDFQAISKAFPDIPMQNVAGNCDYGSAAPCLGEITLNGIRIFYSHGHLYHVKSTYLSILYAARERKADVVLFGHTHRAECFKEDHLWVMNPGAAGQGSYGLIEIEDGTCQCRLTNQKRKGGFYAADN